MTLAKQLTTLKTNIMKNLNNIGLDVTSSQQTAEELNDLLSNYQMFYMNLRGFHWNIRGKRFFELHLKFEELYNDALIKVDEIAERVLTLSATPLHTFKKYLEISEIEGAENITDGEAAISSILEALTVLLKKERAILSIAGDANDEGTVALMSDYIVQQEKLVWMLSAYQN
nr:DPS family protein [uncultured bacterium]